MTLLRHQRMICFDDGADRFQMRAAGIVVRDGRVLVQNVVGDRVSAIPGGRIEQNETSRETLLREIEEEFGRRVEVGPLVFIVESFYPEKGQTFHEIGFYHRIAVPDDFPFHETDVCHRIREGSVELEFRWVKATAASLEAQEFYPVPLRSRLEDLPGSPVHIVDRDPAA